MSEVKVFDIPGSDNVFTIYMLVCKVDDIEDMLKIFKKISSLYDITKKGGEK